MLTWVPLLAGRLSSATDGGINMVEASTVDPLKKKIMVHLKDPIPGKNAWIAFQVICHAFAAANDTAIHRINKIFDNLYVIEIFIKDRLRSSSIDPFVDEWKPNSQKRREEYLKYLRDKKAELEDELKYEQPNPSSRLPSDPNLWNR